MISTEKQDIYKKKINKKYGARKFFVVMTLFLLISYIGLLIATFFISGGVESSPLDITSQTKWKILGIETNLTIYGLSLLAAAVLLFIMQIISIVLICTTVDPRKVSLMQNEIRASQREENMKNKIYDEWKNAQNMLAKKEANLAKKEANIAIKEAKAKEKAKKSK